jgi:hypothetical protein
MTALDEIARYLRAMTNEWEEHHVIRRRTGRPWRRFSVSRAALLQFVDRGWADLRDGYLYRLTEAGRAEIERLDRAAQAAEREAS